MKRMVFTLAMALPTLVPACGGTEGPGEVPAAETFLERFPAASGTRRPHPPHPSLSLKGEGGSS